jgi:ssDNA-binding Zn-finger/Zn-ribbon topoisomerase 1
MDSKRTKITLFNELRGIAKCSKCGSNMVIVQSWKTLASGEKKHWKYMKCSLYRRAGEHGCVNHQPILYEDLKAFILNRLIEKGRDVSLDFDSHVTDKKQMQTLLFGKRITKLEEKKNALVDLYLDRLLTKTEFETKKQELDREIREYEGQLHRLEDRHYSDLKIKTIQQAFQVIGEQGKDLHKAFTALLDEIVVHPDGTVDIAYTFEQGIVH